MTLYSWTFVRECHCVKRDESGKCVQWEWTQAKATLGRYYLPTIPLSELRHIVRTFPLTWINV